MEDIMKQVEITKILLDSYCDILLSKTKMSIDDIFNVQQKLFLFETNVHALRENSTVMINEFCKNFETICTTATNDFYQKYVEEHNTHKFTKIIDCFRNSPVVKNKFKRLLM